MITNAKASQAVKNNPAFKFDVLLELIKKSVAKMPMGSPLFRLDVGPVSIFPSFLCNLPSVEWIDHYKCNCCRHWFDQYADLVWVDNKGVQHSLLWNLTKAECGVEFWDSIETVRYIYEDKPIKSFFYSKDAILGVKTKNNWNHLWISNPFVYRGSGTAYQAEAEKLQDRLLLLNTFSEFTQEVIEKAIAYLSSGTFYRSEKGLPILEWLLKVYKARNNQNLVWREVALAPAGWCHVKNGLVGTLLDDIKANTPLPIIKSNWEIKVDPLNYQRTTTVTEGNIEVAEKQIAELGLESSLQRRFATLEDSMPFIWQPVWHKKSTGLFSELRPTKAPPLSLRLPTVTMTWVKFRSTMLRFATSIKAEVTSTSKLMALVTAADDTSKPILQWDTAEWRNPFSWTYENGGIDSRFKQRVTKAGGQYDDVDIRISLLWDTSDDLDLHVTTPSRGFGREGELIYYGRKKSSCGGWLDIDMNAFDIVKEPVENTRWSKGTAREGIYTVKVNNFRSRTSGPVPFKVEIEINGVTQYFEGVCGKTGTTHETITLHQFNYQRNVRPVVPVSTTGWKEVVGVINSPNLWGSTPKPQHGEHTFFLLKDQKPNIKVGGGLFVETLKSDLHNIRSTLEAYIRQQEIAGSDVGIGGIGNSKSEPWNLHLLVTKDGVEYDIVIDRFD